MISTQHFFHYHDLKIFLHPEVYEPAEDTFFLLEAISVPEKSQVLEIGTGCGLIALFCAAHGADVLCSDINPFAVDLVQKNIKKNQDYLTGSIQVRKGDLFSIVKPKEVFDVIIFNPPYLPKQTHEPSIQSPWYDKATIGGRSGLELTKRFLNEVPNYLARTGSAYTIISSFSGKTDVIQAIKHHQLNYELLKKHRLDEEIISIYRFWQHD